MTNPDAFNRPTEAEPYDAWKTSKETLAAMRLRCQEEGHCFEGFEKRSDGVRVKKCRWCGVRV